jgi:CRISPR-associated protein Cas5d
MAEGIFDVKVGGDYACFSRPEFKVERVSYPVMTPSAARGLLEAILWKPEMRWEIREIDVLKPLKQSSILRNELSDRQGDSPLIIEEKRQQRASLILRDVAYVIHCEIVLRGHVTDPLTKYADMFRRRLERGQCHHTPYLGTREFAAWFEPATAAEEPVPLDLDLGTMLFDIAYIEDASRLVDRMTFNRQDGTGRRTAQGYAEAMFFQAHLSQGRLKVPRELYKNLYRREGDNASRAG